MKTRHLAFLAFLLVSTSPAAAQVTRVVDDDGQGTAADCDAATPALSKVGDGIAAAVDGDTVLVCPGAYSEFIDFGGKAITVRSVGGPAVTALEAKSPSNPVVSFQRGETATSVLEGFTLSHASNSVASGIAIYRASPIIRGNRITQNSACTGSGIFIQSGSAVIEDNTIEVNGSSSGCDPATSGGGGIAISGSSTVIIRRNAISNNSVFSLAAGGGILLSDAGTPTIESNVFWGNLAYYGGAIGLIGRSDATIAGNLIVRNRGGWGGGIYWKVPAGGRGPLVVNNTIAENPISNDGSGVFADGFDAATALYNNNIVAFAAQNAVFCTFGADLNPPVFRFNNVFSGGAKYTGTCTDQTGVNGNISVDPLFIDAPAGNYRVPGASPVVDAGDYLLPGVPPRDLEGRPRVVDGNGDGLAVIDIGAYELLPPPVRGVVLDAPASGNVGAAFVMSGWAVDGRGAATGVDAVHLWAFPETGGAPTFVGAAEYGLPRDDVADALGDPRFTNSGFRLTAPPVLGTGSYWLFAYARSTETGTFELTASVRISVPSLPVMDVDLPVAGATIATAFGLSGWAIDYASLDGPGVDAVHAYAYPAAGGAPVFLGAATYGLDRADVGAAFGADRFNASGWALRAELSPGDYQLAVYARSTVAEAFNQVVVRPVTVVQSRAVIAIDLPESGAPLSQPFNISGWAIDLASDSGPGVYTVHAYAFPDSGAPPVFLGAAAYGAARPDVAAAYGHARFTNSGYTVTVTGLPAGTYLLAAYAGSSVVNDFTAAQTVMVTVGAPRKSAK
jgi:hypothetical protein